MPKPTSPSLLWMDYETYGSKPNAAGLDKMAHQRPTQFAWVRTSLDLTQVLDEGLISCSPGMDHVPLPITVEITGLSPFKLQQEGLSEWAFCQRISELLNVPNTCVVGFNAMGFDHTVTRYLLYRNLFPYYTWEWVDGNSRWDVIDLFRCAEALRPEGIQWPTNEEGLLSMKQEHLARANDCLIGPAHDALGDVQTLVALCRKLKGSHPRLWQHLFAQRRKRAVSDALSDWSGKPFVFISGFLGRAAHHCSVVLQLGSGSGPNQQVCVDLCKPLERWLDSSVEELREALFNGSKSGRPPLLTIKLNQSPVVLPYNILRPADTDRLQLDTEKIEQRRALLSNNPALCERFRQVYQPESTDNPVPPDVDAQMYSGLLSSGMKNQLADFRDSVLAGQATPQQFTDQRYNQLCLRFFGRNFPERLSEAQLTSWHQHCRQRIQEDLPSCRTQLDQLVSDELWTRSETLLNELRRYYCHLEDWANEPGPLRTK